MKITTKKTYKVAECKKQVIEDIKSGKGLKPLGKTEPRYRDSLKDIKSGKGIKEL